MSDQANDGDARTNTKPDAWYRYGVGVLFAEMAIAICVCGYSLTMAFAGLGGFPGK